MLSSRVRSLLARRTTAAVTAVAVMNQMRCAGSSSLGALDDTRMSTWCRRLWALSTTGGPGVDAKAKIKNEKKKTNPVPYDPQEQEEMIIELEKAIQSEKGQLPAVLVESIWEVYHAVLPSDAESDLRQDKALPYTQHFFTLMHLLTTLDCNMTEISDVARQIQSNVTEYVNLAEKIQSMGRDPAKATERNALDAKLVGLKGRVVKGCMDARDAGTPLYYSWLRHTGSMENGIRRLMNFRKTIHAFDIVCKNRVKELQKSLDDALPANKSKTPEEKKNLEELLDLWQARKHDMGLLDGALTFLFHDFFSKEYLVMEELTWFTTPPALLEQIMKAEGVHPFHKGLVDMKDRLQPQHHRHLFAFLHPAVVEEPLIAVQVALTKGIANSVDHILHRPTPLANPMNASVAAQAYQRHFSKYGEDTSDKEEVDTAIFYSINSAQSALRGMDMGNRLIKRVVREIDERINASRRVRQLSPIEHFSTLSPIPGFNRWLKGELEKLHRNLVSGKVKASESSMGHNLFGPGDATMTQVRFLTPLREAILDYANRHNLKDNAHIKEIQKYVSAKEEGGANLSTMEFLSELFLTAEKAEDKWYLDPLFTTKLEGPLLRCIAHYLYQEKKGNGRIRDPVGNFHVSNGAQIYRLNFLGNATGQGSRESACTMVNYLYDIPHISTNVRQYEVSRIVSQGNFIKHILSNQADQAQK